MKPAALWLDNACTSWPSLSPRHMMKNTAFWFESCNTKTNRALIRTRLHDPIYLTLAPISCCSSTLEWCLLTSENKKAGTTDMKAIPAKASSKPVRFTSPNPLLEDLVIITFSLILMRDLFESWYGQAGMITNQVFFLILILTSHCSLP